MPDKEEKKKGMDQFCVGEEKDVVAGEDVLFQNTRTTIQMFKFGCEFSLLISPLHIYKRRPYFGIYLPMLFLPFLLVELVRMVKVCAISFKICMRLGLARKKTNSTHIKEKIVGYAKKKMK